MSLTNKFRVALFAAIVWTIVMRFVSPSNIVEFEFAGTTEAAITIMNDWGEAGIAKAKLSTYLDFIFLILYSAAISLGCKVAAAYTQQPRIIKTGHLLSSLIWIAGLSDAVENIAMLRTIALPEQLSVSIAYYAAIIKFSIVAVGLLFIIAMTLAGSVMRLKRKTT